MSLQTQEDEEVSNEDDLNKQAWCKSPTESSVANK